MSQIMSHLIILKIPYSYWDILKIYSNHRSQYFCKMNLIKKAGIFLPAWICKIMPVFARLPFGQSPARYRIENEQIQRWKSFPETRRWFVRADRNARSETFRSCPQAKIQFPALRHPPHFCEPRSRARHQPCNAVSDLRTFRLENGNKIRASVRKREARSG